jgi:hypothetical protein
MRPVRTTALTLLAAATVAGLSACWGPGAGSGFAPSHSTRKSTRGNAAVTIEGAALRQSERTLLGSLRGRLTGLEVHYGDSECPELTLRGPKSLVGPNDPVIYVDGNRAANTCILEMLNPVEVARIEVYPMGVVSQPGIKSNANGIILIFLRDGTDQA